MSILKKTIFLLSVTMCGGVSANGDSLKAQTARRAALAVASRCVTTTLKAATVNRSCGLFAVRVAVGYAIRHYGPSLLHEIVNAD